MNFSPSGQAVLAVCEFSGDVPAHRQMENSRQPRHGSVLPDGRQLRLSERGNDVVYVLDTRSGELVRASKVGQGPHGLTSFSQPGHHSLGHIDNHR